MGFSRKFALCLPAIMISIFAAFTAGSAADGKPVAVIAADTHHFGEVWEGSDIIHEFVIKNTGNADLEIKSVKSG